GFRVITIEKDTFNHGGTRQRAVGEKISDHVVFLTQDAVIADTDALKNLLQYFNDKNVAAVCGRQLPRIGAGAIEAHARLFNYPDRSFTRTIHDVEKYGLKTAFISDSFAAYRVTVLSEIGGFPDNVIFGEDMYVSAKLLIAGYRIAYAADACVYHSHDYSLMQEMKRYFDMGVFHAREPWLRLEFGAAEGEGVKFVTSELGYLLRHAFWRIPEGLIRIVFRYTGFRLGLGERHISLTIKRKLSMSPGYFNK
ncbi:MAG: glycosyltransferase, partial [Gammaproteobacteria bacterium]|nr:glycosyltransferase [Gammaproteobacteria bacterium]